MTAPLTLSGSAPKVLDWAVAICLHPRQCTGYEVLPDSLCQGTERGKKSPAGGRFDLGVRRVGQVTQPVVPSLIRTRMFVHENRPSIVFRDSERGQAATANEGECPYPKGAVWIQMIPSIWTASARPS